MEILKKLVGKWFRKVVFTFGAVWIAKLIESGVLTDGDVERIVEIAVAALFLLIPALWTDVILPWIKKATAKLAK